MAISLKDVQFYPLGDAAIILHFGETLSHRIQQSIFSISNYLEEYSFEGLIEYVPAYTSITLFYNPMVVEYAEIIQNLEEMMDEITVDLYSETTTTIEIPVWYGGEGGPDLEIVSKHCKMTIDEVIDLHTGGDYLVNMIGFAPGFPYLSGMNQALSTPRRENPRAIVNAGSVGIAGMQTGVYPMATPGGWQLIGKTPLKLFDLSRNQPALLKSGDRLRFVSINETEFNHLTHGN